MDSKSFDIETPVEPPGDVPPEQPETSIDSANGAEGSSDPWVAYYSANATPEAWVTFCTRSEMSSEAFPLIENWTYETGTKPCPSPRATSLPPVLIDSGASGTVVGWKWIQQWGGLAQQSLGESNRSFRFGDGIERPIVGTCIIPILLAPGHTNQPQEFVLNILADVAHADVPLLISRRTLVSLQGKLDFTRSILLVGKKWKSS